MKRDILVVLSVQAYLLLIGSILYGTYLSAPESYYLAFPGGFLGTLLLFLSWKGKDETAREMKSQRSTSGS